MPLAQKQTYRRTEQNREPNNKLKHLQLNNLQQRKQVNNGEMPVSSTSGNGKARQPHQW